MSEPTKREIEFLTMLAIGVPFEEAAMTFGDDGLKISFRCILSGWVSQGELTPAGRSLVPRGADKAHVAVGMMVTDLRTGKVVS